jgi:23S rRNA (adenine2503-C2)-methyltransferase
LSPSLYAILPEELAAWLSTQGQPAYRAGQILRWVHGQRVTNPELMTNLPASLRQGLAHAFPLPPVTVTHQAHSTDGTRKLRLAFSDGGAVETVLIPDEDKLTQCLSTQVGCAMGCRFCLSGSRGLARNLTADEILLQVHQATAVMDPGERLSNIVLMGSGEPLANYQATKRAVQLMISPQALGLSSRRVTISTVGLPRGIRRLGQDFQGQIGLAVSLHGPDDETRARLLPRLRRISVRSIVDALRAYPLPRRRRITIEYVLVRGINDRPDQAVALAKTLSSLRVKVNLIPFNEHSAVDLQPPDEERVEAFQLALLGRNVPTILRRQRGADIGAACGQLAASPTS